jgi:hypothetical protein
MVFRLRLTRHASEFLGALALQRYSADFSGVFWPGSRLTYVTGAKRIIQNIRTAAYARLGELGLPETRKT